MKHRIAGILSLCLIAAAMPAVVLAAPGPYLKSLYTNSKDLQKLFDAKTYLVKPAADTAAISLEDWARQYGWRDDTKLAFYKPAGAIPVAVKKEVAPTIQATGYVVIDKNSGLIVAEQNAGTTHSVASLTKLMTVNVVLSHKVPLSRIQPITADDQVGGSSLGVKPGTKFSVEDLFYAALLPSANDAANALAAATKLSREKFIAEMNAKAQELSLSRTVFADPTGIDEGNVSTPREFALIADKVFRYPSVQHYATTGQRTLRALPSKKKIIVKNSDFLLTKPQFDDVLVTAGKTGYLGPDTGWNLAVEMRSATGASRPLTLVLFGAPKLAQIMADADAMAQWTWGHYKWK